MEAAFEKTMWGEYEHAVDDKGRVILPLDFRKPLGDEFLATRGPDRCVWLLPASVWSSLSSVFQGDLLHPAAAALQRMFGGTMTVKLDGQFRLAIPKHLRAWAGIGEPDVVTIAGQGSKIEVWQRNAWLEQMKGSFSSEAVFSYFQVLAGPAPTAASE